jgi:hypothetical protein
VLCAALVFFVAAPLALSSPYPTPKDGSWLVQRPSFELASASSLPAVIASPREPAPKAESAPVEIDPPPLQMASLGPTAIPVRPAAPATADPAPTGSISRTEPNGSKTKPVSPLRRPVSIMDEVDRYLWEVYQRQAIKRDRSGDFSWKDPSAARRVNMSVQVYVIGGMDPDFREQLYHAGRAMDAAGIHWSILSAFRDDYRQRLASGYKARPGNSLHGGSRATGGYGHGRAVDLMNSDGNNAQVWRWIDANGARYGLVRPMPGNDPAHVRPGGDWHRIAVALRETRNGRATRTAGRHTRVARASQ